MVMGLRIALVLGAILLLFMGTGFLIDPAASGQDFGLQAAGAHGLTSLRADLTAFFWVSGGCLIWGVWQKRRDPLIIGGALMLVTLAARIVGLFIDGGFEGFLTPMIVELLIGGLALIASQVLPEKT